ncbi:hypothetical protein JB92DRAFT_3104491 [Gautieria morchelliformis]|nr:hypothetical protein JB92DRAFT_3104491 [Gautieria morchelliformis]
MNASQPLPAPPGPQVSEVCTRFSVTHMGSTTSRTPSTPPAPTPPSATRTSPCSPRERRSSSTLTASCSPTLGTCTMRYSSRGAAMCDMLISITRPVEYRVPRRAGAGRGNDYGDSGGGMDTDGTGLDTRHAAHSANFELADYWSEAAEGYAAAVRSVYSVLDVLDFELAGCEDGAAAEGEAGAAVGEGGDAEGEAEGPVVEDVSNRDDDAAEAEPART